MIWLRASVFISRADAISENWHPGVPLQYLLTFFRHGIQPNLASRIVIDFMALSWEFNIICSQVNRTKPNISGHVTFRNHWRRLHDMMLLCNMSKYSLQRTTHLLTYRSFASSSLFPRRLILHTTTSSLLTLQIFLSLLLKFLMPPLEHERKLQILELSRTNSDSELEPYHRTIDPRGTFFPAVGCTLLKKEPAALACRL